MIAGFQPRQTAIVIGVEAFHGAQVEMVDQRVLPSSVKHRSLLGWRFLGEFQPVPIQSVNCRRAVAYVVPSRLILAGAVIFEFGRQGNFVGRGIGQARCKMIAEHSIVGAGQSLLVQRLR